MNNEICEKNMDAFLSLDKYERIPLGVTLHLLTCKKCRTQVRYLTLAEKYASEPIRATPIRDALENIPVKPVSMAKWVISGFLMIFLMVIFGVLVTVYCALFVGTNMDFFIKKMPRMETAG